MTVVRRNLHGVVLEIVCDADDASQVVGRRLSPFPSSSAEPELSITLRTDGVAASGGARPADIRVVHETPAVSIAYSDSVDELWVDYAGHATAWCRPAAGEARISIDRSVDSWPWIASRPLLTVTLLELLKRRGLFGVHAAAVARSGRAVLLSGSSGSGKSTVSLALLLAGWSFLGDDIVFLQGAEVLAFPDEIDASEATIGFFPELGAAADWPMLTGYPKHQISAGRVRPGATVPAATPSVLLLPQLGGGTDHVLERVEPGEALIELVPNLLLTEGTAAQAQLSLLAALTEGLRTYRLHLGSRIDDLPPLLEALVDTAGQPT